MLLIQLNVSNAIGSYHKNITIKELGYVRRSTLLIIAVRNATIQKPDDKELFERVIFDEKVGE